MLRKLLEEMVLLTKRFLQGFVIAKEGTCILTQPLHEMDILGPLSISALYCIDNWAHSQFFS